MSQCSDDVFGPFITQNGCRSGFDFTLLFEEAILSLVPSVILIVVCPARLLYLLRQDVKAPWSKSSSTRQILLATFAALQIALLCEWTLSSAPQVRTAIPAASLRVVDALLISLLSAFEYTRSVRPSTVLNLYFFFSLLFDTIQLRTLWLLHNQPTLAAIASASIGVKMAILVLETRHKRTSLFEPYRHLSIETLSGIFSRCLFWWLNPLIYQGFSTLLSLSDMCQLEADLDSQLLERIFLQTWNSSKVYNKCRLLRVTLWSVKGKLGTAAVSRLLQSCFTFCQPFLIFRVIDYIEAPRGNDRDRAFGYGLIGATAAIYLGLAFSSTIYKHKTYQMITQIRGGLIALVYQKTLHLHTVQLSENAAMTLMTNDTNMIATSWTNVHEMWASVIDVGVSIFLLQHKLGIACIAPVVVAVLSTLTSGQIAKWLRTRQNRWLGAVQGRIGFTSKFLLNLKGLKMMGLASQQGQQVQSLREREITKAKSYLYIDAAMNVCANSSQLLSPVATLLLFAFTNSNMLTSSVAYYTLTVVALMSSPLSLALTAFPSFLASLACFSRIETYLQLEERRDYRLFATDNGIVLGSLIVEKPSVKKNRIQLTGAGLSPSDSRSETDADIFFLIKDASFGYDRSSPPVLTNITWDCLSKTFTLLLGPVGCGKSTLLKALLAEVTCFNGSVYLSQVSIAYCGQTAWLQNDTLRDNILGGQPLDEKLYQDVIYATCLDTDISSFPLGDNTSLGVNAIKLSGGQAQRVAVARAVYARKSMLLLDDCFSGLDNRTQSLISHRLFGPSGLLKRLGTTVVLATHSIHLREHADLALLLTRDGTLQKIGNPTKFMLKEGILPNKLGQIKPSSEHSGLDEEDSISHDGTYNQTPQLSTEDSVRQYGDLAIYKYYIASMGIRNLLIFLGLNAISTFGARFGQVWVGFWVNATSSHPNHGVNYMYGGVYAAIGLGSLVFFGLVMLFMFQVMVPRSARQLHKSLLKATIHATYGFHAAIDPGVTLNRFSQDMTLIDLDLPSYAVGMVIDIFTCIGQAILMCIGAKYIAIFMPALLIIVYLIQMVYLKTSRQVRCLDLEAKSPLFSHILETASGLETIRAYGWEQRFRETNTNYLDNSQRPFYTLYCIQRWLGLVLALMVAVIAILLITFGTQVKGQTTANSMGTALINVVSFSQTLSLLISSYTSLETALGAIARIQSFISETPQEDDTSMNLESSPAGWLDESPKEIQLDSINVSYTSTIKPVLQDISLILKPGMKIGICGRSGSGKSSLILALLRMIPVVRGSIRINRIEISTIPSDLVRSIFIVIPQSPILFPGSIRLNLDPSSTHTDSALHHVLSCLGLSELVSSRGGLDADIETMAFSHGHKQLLCIGRSILEKDRKKIVIVDEFTSSMDAETEAFVMRLIEQEFSAHTVLAIAHRLNTVRRFDQVVILDQGRVVESGSPDELLGRREGWFKDLWSQEQVGGTNL